MLVLGVAAFQDFRKRKITTVTFLVFDAALLVYYLLTNPILSFFVIPVILEFFLKKLSLIPYILFLIPLIFDMGVVTIALTYSILMVKIFGLAVKNFGRGDVKALQTISVALPFYPFLPYQDSLFPPVLAITLLASILGLVSSLYVLWKNRGTGPGRRFGYIPSSNLRDKDKFFIRGDEATYKIPFVTFVSISFFVFFILSLLRLV